MNNLPHGKTINLQFFGNDHYNQIEKSALMAARADPKSPQKAARFTQ